MRNIRYLSLVAIYLLSCATDHGQRKDATSRPTASSPVAVVKAGDKAGDKKVKPLPWVKWSGQEGDRWQTFNKLKSEQKYEKASKELEKILAQAKGAKDSEDWVRALTRYVKLRTALHGYEKAVRFLKEEPWPGDVLATTALDLYYAHALVTYAQRYSWEIRKREKVDSKGKVDLKAWTSAEIYAEAQRAYQNVWVHRQQLADHPISHLSDFLEQNDYPKHIRPTLRDAVSYLRVELLANTATWGPKQSNEKYQIDLPRLLGQKKPLLGKAQKLEDPELHPLVKIATTLLDLEAWHEEKGRQESAFEARLTLVKLLHRNFTNEDDRRLLLADLERRLPAMRKFKWWSVGMALRAHFVQTEKTWDNQLRARKIAIAGHAAYPQSVGGKRCLNIFKRIEVPQYDIQAMAADGPQRRSLAINYKNLDRIYFRAFRVDLKKHFQSGNDYNFFPRHNKLSAILRSSKPAHSWNTKLEKTIDYKKHRAFVVPPMKKPGYYAVMASARKDFSKDDNVIRGAHMVIGDLVMIKRSVGDEVEVEMVSGSTGKLLAGVRVHLYRFDYRKGHRSVASKTTGANGIVVLKKGKLKGNSYFLFARKGKQIAVDPSYLHLYARGRSKTRRSTLIYTDRSIYRPNQMLKFKAILYKGDVARSNYKTAPNTKVSISLYDGNYQRVSTQKLKTNSFGTVSGEFQIPSGRLLGSWRIRSSFNGQTNVRVEEYKRPTFTTKLHEATEPMRLNKKAKVKGEARYHFGLPLTNGQVKWRVLRSVVYPWWWHYRYSSLSSSSSQSIGAGTTKVSADGSFAFSFVPKADERLAKTAKGVTYRYSVSVDVTDEGGETRSAQKGFRLGFVDVEAKMSFGSSFLLAGKLGKLKIFRSNLNGKGTAGKGHYRVFSVKSPKKALLPADQPLASRPITDKSFVTTGDRLRPRWRPNYQVQSLLWSWPDGALLSEGDLTHDQDGVAKIDLVAIKAKLKAGAYRLRYQTKDGFGAPYEMSQVFVVAGKKTSLALPVYAEVERSSVKVGKKAQIHVFSGFPGQRIYLDTYRHNKRVRRQTLIGKKSPTLIEIPVREKDRGGFGIAVTAVRDHQLMRFQRSVYVPWDNKSLKVSFSTFRDRLRPGTKETFTVKVRGPAGKDSAVAGAEVLAYMYDKSLDAFTPHYPAQPISIYPWLTQIPWTRSNLGMARTTWVDSRGFRNVPWYPPLRGDRLKTVSGYGVGGVGGRGFGRGGGGRYRIRSEAPRPVKVAEASVDASPADTPAATTRSAMKAKRKVAVNKPLRNGDSQAKKKGPQLRTNFSETAFFKPHLLTDKDGSVSFKFEVPDSVTSWNVWAHAVTRDLQSGSVKKENKSVKELMVRPYLPRFLREGDNATIKVVVNNASKKALKGRLKFDIIDPDTKKSILASFGLKSTEAQGRPFEVKAGGGTNLSFSIKTPAKVGLVAFKVTATSGDFSDGELRPIPVLPGRMHLIQSRFVSLKDKDRREMRFEDLAKDDDPSLINEQMVVTIDAQLFYSVLSALPYLVNYPYQCTEQTLNRFLSTGILSSMYKDYPAVKKMAAKFAKRKTQYERFDGNDPNRKMALEETPWLQMSQGGPKRSHPLLNVLDPKIARAQRNTSLAELKKAQTSSGAFPWFAGGRPSPYMTLYLLHGFSKAMEFGVDVPKPMIQRAWRYMHRHYVDKWVKVCMAHNSCWEFITFLNYTLSNYPDNSWGNSIFTAAERKTMLDFSFKHWKNHAPYLKGYLALTLNRENRRKDALLVWESVMDSAKTKKDQGTFWAPEDRGWLWYNDRIETHAFAVRTVMELTPKAKELDGLVLWLLINKKLSHWKSTRATSEVVYSLAKYLKSSGQLGVKEKITVSAGDQKKVFAFSPDEYTGRKNQWVIPGAEMKPKKHASIIVEKDTKGFAFASATWHFSTEKLPAVAKGDFLSVKRKYFKRSRRGGQVILQPLADGTQIKVGDEVEVQLALRSKHKVGYVHLRDPRPAGFEPVSTQSRHRGSLGIYWYEEIRDSGTNFFFESLPTGQYPFKYRLRATTAGTFKSASATVQPMYAPEFAGYSSGKTITIKPLK
jgi:alpha-2-macroglobulin